MNYEDSRFSLTGNTLKMIGLLSMTVDHVGLILLNNAGICRIIGRLAFPIFACMVAEGCLHTRNRLRYFLQLALLALICQTAYYVADGSLYMCVMVTFTLSVPAVYLLHDLRQRFSGVTLAVFVLYIALIWIVTELVPARVKDVSDFAVDYGFWGVMLPVFASVYPEDRQKNICFIALGLIMLCLSIGGLEYWALPALVLLLMYNGQRGKARLKYLFYFYYPLHLAAIHGLAQII